MKATMKLCLAGVMLVLCGPAFAANSDNVFTHFSCTADSVQLIADRVSVDAEGEMKCPFSGWGEVCSHNIPLKNLTKNPSSYNFEGEKWQLFGYNRCEHCNNRITMRVTISRETGLARIWEYNHVGGGKVIFQGSYICEIKEVDLKF